MTGTQVLSVSYLGYESIIPIPRHLWRSDRAIFIMWVWAGPGWSLSRRFSLSRYPMHQGLGMSLANGMLMLQMWMASISLSLSDLMRIDSSLWASSGPSARINSLISWIRCNVRSSIQLWFIVHSVYYDIFRTYVLDIEQWPISMEWLSNVIGCQLKLVLL